MTQEPTPRTPQEYEVLTGAGAEAAEQARQGLSRRQLLRRVVGVTAALVGIEAVGGALVMLYPGLGGGFGSKITLKKTSDYPAAKPADFSLVNGRGVFYEAEAQTYLVHLASDTPWLRSGAELDDLLTAEWFVKDPSGDGSYWLAIWQRCVHLGCKFNFREDCTSFKCPCHGSHYNNDGEYLSGPAPRSNDRFQLTIKGGAVVVDTGKLNQKTQRPSPSTLLLTELPVQFGCQ
jgi:cytochrome b6-f complex iron-sulfur subunit